MPPIVLAKKGVIGCFFYVVKWGCKFAFQAELCKAHTSCVNHFRPQYYTFHFSALCRAQATSYSLCAHPRYNNWLMYIVVRWPRHGAG